MIAVHMMLSLFVYQLSYPVSVAVVAHYVATYHNDNVHCVSSMELCIMPTINLLFGLKKVFDDKNITWVVADGVSIQLARKQEYLNAWERVEQY